MNSFQPLTDQINALPRTTRFGEVAEIGSAHLKVRGLARFVRVGDLVSVACHDGETHEGEVVASTDQNTIVMLYDADARPAIGNRVKHLGPARLFASNALVGRVINAFGAPIDGKPLAKVGTAVSLRAKPPSAHGRRGLGARLRTGLSALDTVLPLVAGQRIGIFAGSGVGKTTLLGQLARGVATDRVVIGLIGERGREVGDFLNKTLGKAGLERSVVVVATSDQSPLVKRRAAWTAMAIAEGFRDQGEQVLLILDSITRFAEAHREIALTAGEPPTLRAYPPSTANMLAGLTERAGTGVGTAGDITAIFSVLVAGSDMEEPIADMVRGLLDGHFVLDRDIAERGRFPAIDFKRSVSRSLPEAATPEENALIAEARRIVGLYEKNEVLVKTGLYTAGTDTALDEALTLWPRIDRFLSLSNSPDIEASFDDLRDALGRKPSTNLVVSAPAEFDDDP